MISGCKNRASLALVYTKAISEDRSANNVSPRKLRAMHPVELSSVASLSIFKDLSESDLKGVLSSARLSRYQKLARIFVQGDPAVSFFVLVDGYVQATKTSQKGEEIVVRYISPGDLFGLAPAIGMTQYPATALAVVDVVALAWASTSWPTLSATYPQLATYALKTVGARLQEAHERVIELTTEEVEQRIARVLIRLAEQAGRAASDGTEIEFPLRRQDVAQLTGTTLHSASRVLSRWEEQGLIGSAHQHIVVCNVAALLRIAEHGRS